MYLILTYYYIKHFLKVLIMILFLVFFVFASDWLPTGVRFLGEIQLVGFVTLFRQCERLSGNSFELLKHIYGQHADAAQLFSMGRTNYDVCKYFMTPAVDYYVCEWCRDWVLYKNNLLIYTKLYLNVKLINTRQKKSGQSLKLQTDCFSVKSNNFNNCFWI